MRRPRGARVPCSASSGIALVAAAVHAVIATALPVPWIMPDELIYGELRKSLASGGLPAIRGEVTTGYGILYPLLIAPAWALFDDPLQPHRTRPR